MSNNVPSRFIDQMKRLDGSSFQAYGELIGSSFGQNDYHILFKHIQGSPGAFPASIVCLSIATKDIGLPEHCLSNSFRQTATADYLLRALSDGVGCHARQNRGSQGSGSFQPWVLPPQVLKRNMVRFLQKRMEIDLRISLPASESNRILADHAIVMLTRELPQIVTAIKSAVGNIPQLKRHCDTVEDFFVLQSKLDELNLVAFIGDGAVLPRESGISQRPLHDAVPFKAPKALARYVHLPHAGKVRGWGISPGVNVVIGSGFHGKSTLLAALAKGVYPHIPSDGREQVVTHPKAVYICAEEGRSVKGVDISDFIPELPRNENPRALSTDNASSSVSQAAAVMEAVWAKAKLLLLDEDTSAANFLIRDRLMRRLIPQDHSTPFYDHVQGLFAHLNISTLIVIGGSSEYLGVATQVIAMQNYHPVQMTDKVQRLALPCPSTFPKPLSVNDPRRISAGHFDPSYRASRLGKIIPIRIKPLRLQEKILEFGDERVDLSAFPALIDADQTLAIGYALLWTKEHFPECCFTPAELAETVIEGISGKGLDFLRPEKNMTLFFAAPRPLELAGAVNRIRKLVCEKRKN